MNDTLLISRNRLPKRKSQKKDSTSISYVSQIQDSNNFSQKMTFTRGYFSQRRSVAQFYRAFAIYKRRSATRQLSTQKDMRKLTPEKFNDFLKGNARQLWMKESTRLKFPEVKISRSQTNSEINMEEFCTLKKQCIVKY